MTEPISSLDIPRPLSRETLDYVQEMALAGQQFKKTKRMLYKQKTAKPMRPDLIAHAMISEIIAYEAKGGRPARAAIAGLIDKPFSLIAALAMLWPLMLA